MTTAVQSLTLRVAADSWNGDPNFIVTVDGVQVGGVQTTSASHAKGQWQDITLTGDFGADPSKVAVSFINDAWGGTASTDRNLYVQSLTLNGTTYLGSALPATLGPAATDSAALNSNGTITFATGAQNTLTLRVAADSWNGDPNFVVTVDGVQVGGVQTTSASHAKGQWQDITLTGDFGADPSKVAVSFINDAWGGTASTDRNLYVQSLTLNGTTYLGSALPATLGPAATDSAALNSNGTITFATGAQNTLTLRVAADSWNGDPNFVVTVDGVQVGGVQTTSASHAKGQWQDITLTGNFSADPSKVAVSFINDAWGGTASTDRNLYVQSLTLNGNTYLGSALPATLGPAAADSAVLNSNGTITFATTPTSGAATTVAAIAAPVITAFASPLVASSEPVISGTAAAGLRVSIFVDGATSPIAVVTSTAIGTWSYTPAGPLADGIHSFTARATDASGTVSAASASQSLTIDTTPPTAPSITAFTSPLTRSNEPTISGTAEAGAKVAITVDGAKSPLASVTAAADGTWTYTPTSTLTDGIHSFTAVATDAAGNASTISAAQSLTVDTTPPTAPLIAAFASALSRSNEPTVSGTAEAGAKVAITLDGAKNPLASVTAAADGTWTYTPTSTLTDGVHSFTAVATDAAGNASTTSAARSLTVDTAPPSERLTALTVAGDNIVDGIEGAGDGVVVTGTLSAGLAAGDTLVVTIGGVATAVPTNDINGTTFAFTSSKPSGGWAIGTATATAQVQDAAGNASASLSQSYTVTPATTGHMALLGVNLSGGEYSANKLPGVVGTDYTYPTDTEIDYYASKGLNVIRLPFLWERVQPTEDGPLSQSEMSQIDSVVNYANSKGMKVILDPHNYGSGYGNLIGSTGTPTSAFADLWGKLAAHYASNGDVMFGLMNEPQVSTASAWLGDANAAITAIRNAGATSQEVLVPGTYYDGANTWTTTDNASVLGNGIKDPNNNFAFEVHQYLDSDGSGTHANVVSSTIGSSRLAAITQWAKNTGSKLFLGEFGVAQDATSLSAMNDMLSFMNKNSDVWQGGTDWAAGPWLGNNIYSIEPSGLGTGHVTDKAQMGVLQNYAPGHF